ncbi:hypothetical protein MESS4_510152 [Mesorhizobium sp. STM 4661]|nr:hypothetical protein MESS4_510152 [Mesorhizobium sp. STM 4661]
MLLALPASLQGRSGQGHNRRGQPGRRGGDHRRLSELQGQGLDLQGGRRNRPGPHRVRLRGSTARRLTPRTSHPCKGSLRRAFCFYEELSRMHFHLTEVSTNSKTGPIPVATVSNESCPTSCPLLGAGCYAENGPLRIHWDAVTKKQKGWNSKNLLKGLESCHVMGFGGMDKRVTYRGRVIQLIQFN